MLANAMYGAAETAVKQQGQSGKITIYDSDKGESDANQVQITMDFLYERDSNDNIVGLSGNPNEKHSLQQFANQNFAFSGPTQTEYSGVDTDLISFTSPVYQAGTIKIDMYIMKESGTITTSAGETFDVKEDDVKFNIELIDWKFCNPCADGTSNKIDVGVSIKGKKDQASEGSGSEYNLGGRVNLILSSKIVAGDNTIVNMPDGYPKTIDQGGKQLFVFRFPKVDGQSHYVYDPVVEYSGASCKAFNLVCRLGSK